MTAPLTQHQEEIQQNLRAWRSKPLLQEIYAARKPEPGTPLQAWTDAVPREYAARYAVALLDRTNGTIRLLRSAADGSPSVLVASRSAKLRAAEKL
jgi:hypothetical protein